METINIGGKEYISTAQLKNILGVSAATWSKILDKFPALPDVQLGNNKYWLTSRLGELKANVANYKKLSPIGRPAGSIGIKQNRKKRYTQLPLIKDGE